MIEHNKPTLGKQEQRAVSKVLESGYIAQGLEVERFENEFCDFLDLPEGHAVALSSGTSALFMALWSLNAKNKSIAMPVYACSALRNAVAMAQAKEPNISFMRIGDNPFPALLNPIFSSVSLSPCLVSFKITILRLASFRISNSFEVGRTIESPII